MCVVVIDCGVGPEGGGKEVCLKVGHVKFCYERNDLLCVALTVLLPPQQQQQSEKNLRRDGGRGGGHWLDSQIKKRFLRYLEK